MHNPNICMQQIIAEGITALMTIIEYEPVSHSQTLNCNWLQMLLHTFPFIYIGSKGSNLGIYELD